METLKESTENTEFNSADHAREQVEYRTVLLEGLSKIYNDTHKEIRKQQTMLSYYQKQLNAQ